MDGYEENLCAVQGGHAATDEEAEWFDEFNAWFAKTYPNVK